MDIVTLRTKTQDELHQMLAEQRTHLTELRFQLSIRELKNVHDIRATRRTIARILTILNSQPIIDEQSERVAA